MLIFGTTTLNLKRDAGFFYCPICRDQAEYRKRLAKQFFTLYFIPLIPIGNLGEFIQCDRCRHQFDLDILNFDPETEKREVMDIYVRMMMLMMMETGQVGRHHLEILGDAIEHRFQERPGEEELLGIAEDAENVDAKLIHYATRIGRTCDPAVCFDLIQVATQILASEGQPTPEHQELLIELGTALRLPDDVVRQLWEPHSQDPDVSTDSSQES